MSDREFDIEYLTNGDSVLTAFGFDDVREDMCGWGANPESHETNIVDIDILVARGFRLDVDGNGACIISGHFPQPIEVDADRPWEYASDTEKSSQDHKRIFTEAVRAKLGPALSAKYLNA